MELIELLSPRPSRLWPLVKQCGVNGIAALMNGAEQDQRMFRSVGVAAEAASADRDLAPWSEKALARDIGVFAEGGFSVQVIEDTPPLDKARAGADGRDEQIEHVITQVRAMGNLGIPVLCYNWMAVTSWARTSIETRARGGALVTAFDAEHASAQDHVVEPGEVTAEQLWEALRYFLDAVVPEAEAAGVQLAMHPDDPPRPVVRGVPRIMSSVEGFRRLLDLNPSPANGITLCQGNFALMTDDLPSVIREFGERRRIGFVHFRDVAGTADDFVETFHDDGPTDMLACLNEYENVGFRGALRPDHVPTMAGEANDMPGYGTLGRLFALGYIRGLQEGLAK
ncbi:mannonate dehydratase [Microbacterium hominis]|uniref:mannonate dehydratase n=1 Tax=Microbacterium hominis TaxID=162426 RepID=A0A7D4UFN5_9MICO|nr:mannonate dehydratase [Microbacterium hominis]QKJ18529.1 mannonate dehydratase [Microbacterium hominis]